jgi:pimeloyl-ACP methyl ester carboxylesterase
MALVTAGCVTLRPYDQAVRAVPAGDLLPVGGRRIHVQVAGDGFPLILLHGFGGSTVMWDAVVPRLAAERRVVAIDLNGFGFTERPASPAAYTIAGQAALVLAVADRLGLARFDVGGHSYGGGIALYLAAHYPARVRTLVLVDNTLPAYGVLRRHRLFASRTLVRLFVHSVALSDRRIRSGLEEAYADDRRVTPELVRAYADRLRVEGAVNAFYGLVAPNGQVPDRVDLAKIAQPALVVWGSRDALIPEAEGRRHAAEMPAARFLELEGCGHNPMEECPAAFLAGVEPFLAATATLL